MKRTLSPIERLDRVARAQTATILVSRVRILLLFLTIFIAWLGISSKAPSGETLLVRVLTAATATATVILWLKWRYKLYAPAVLSFAWMMGSVLVRDHPRPHTVFGMLAQYSMVPMFAYYGCGLWVMARRYAQINGADWKNEREQVAEWLKILASPAQTDLVEFSTGNFWKGYWKYRLLKTADCWMVAIFKRGTTKLAACYVRQPNDITLTPLPSGKWKVDILLGKKKMSFPEVDISPELSSRLGPIAQHASS